MTHLRIEQNTTGVEEVSASVVNKLYELAISGDLDATSVLLGRLNCTSAYLDVIDYLTLTYSNLYITANKYYVNVGDPAFESLLATEYGDGIGVTLVDLLTISWLGGTKYQNNTNITDASVLRKCSNLTSINDNAFRGCTALTTVAFPDSLTELSYTNGDPSFYGAFRDCTSLRNITFGSGLLTISNRCFTNCTSLENVSLPANITGTDGYSVFGDCSNLKTVSIAAQTFSSTGGGIFYNDTKLHNVPVNKFTHVAAADFVNVGSDSVGLGAVVLPNILQTTWGNMGARFLGTKMTSFTMSSSTLTKIWDEADRGWNWGGFNFSYNEGLTKIDLSGCSALTEISYGLCRTEDDLTTVKLPASLTTIGQYLCANCPALLYVVLPATTPPTISNPSLVLQGSADANIYVPDAAVTAYQNDSGWSTYSTRIKPMSLLPSNI